jgi:hypothetical protein
MYGPLASLYAEMFPPEVRYTGVSLGYQVGGMLGGLVPLLAESLLLRFNDASWVMAGLLAILAVVSLVSVLNAQARYSDAVHAAPAAIDVPRQVARPSAPQDVLALLEGLHERVGALEEAVTVMVRDRDGWRGRA